MGEDLVGFGKIAEAIERGTREVRELVQDFLSPVLKEAGQYLADRIKFNRINAAIRALQIAKEQVVSSGMEQKPVSLKILAPALEWASLEEDEDLISLWAGLIASAATTGDTLPAFGDILRQLSPQEARILNFTYENATQKQMMQFAVDRRRLQEYVGVANEEFLLYLQNLDRLGTIMNLGTSGMDAPGGRGWGNVVYVGLSALGLAFVRACRGPGKRDSGCGPKQPNAPRAT
jgi:hypothetical protein